MRIHRTVQTTFGQTRDTEEESEANVPKLVAHLAGLKD
jgi:hypothetical protein